MAPDKTEGEPARATLLQSMKIFTDLDEGLMEDHYVEVRRLHRLRDDRVQGPLPEAVAARADLAAADPARPGHGNGLYDGLVLIGPEKKQHKTGLRVPTSIDIDSGSELNVLGPEDLERLQGHSDLTKKALKLYPLERPVRVVAANQQNFAEDARYGCRIDVQLGDGQIARQVQFVLLPGFSARASFNSDLVLGKPFLENYRVVLHHDSDPKKRTLHIRRSRLHADTLYSAKHGDVEVVKCKTRAEFLALLRQPDVAAFILHGDHAHDDPVLDRGSGDNDPRDWQFRRERATLRRLRALVARRRPQTPEESDAEDGKPVATGDWFSDPEVQKEMEERFRTGYADIDGETGDPVPEELLRRRPAMTLDLISADAEPATAKCRRPTQVETEIARAKLADMLGRRVIRPCQSNWSACALWIPKPPDPVTGKPQAPRLTIDWRGLNERIRADEHPLPLIEEIIDDVISGGPIYGSLDMHSGYDHLPLREDHQHRAAFILLGGLWCPTRAGQGIKTSPAKFTRWVMSEFRDEIEGVWKNMSADGTELRAGDPAGTMVCTEPGYCRFYIDDCIVMAPNERLFEQRMHHVLRKMRRLGIRIKTSKSALWKKELKFLGFRLRHGSKSADPAMVSAVLESATPTNRKQLKSFLGAASFFRSFIDGYANLAYPLEAVVTQDHDSKRLLWTPLQQDAYDEILRRLATLPSLRAPRWRDPYVCQCDASDVAMGGALLQRQDDGHLYPVAYWSQRLSPAEIVYGVHEKESLAVKTMCLRYRHFLLNGKTHRVEVDNAATVHLFKKTANKLSLREQRLVHQLANFSLDIVHVTGTVSNPAADWLSRRIGAPALKRRRLKVIEFCSGVGSLLYGLLAARDFIPPDVTIEYTAVDFAPAAQAATRKAYLHCQATAPGLLVRPVNDIYFRRPKAGRHVHDLRELLELWQTHSYKIPTGVHLVVATPSCQPYSRAVRHKLAEGLRDERDLFHIIAPLLTMIKAKSPNADFVVENVPFGLSRSDTHRKPHQPWGDWNAHLRGDLEKIDGWMADIDDNVHRDFHPMRFYGPTTRVRMIWTTIRYKGRNAAPPDRKNWQDCIPKDCTVPSLEAPAMVATVNSHSDRSGAAHVHMADGRARPMSHNERECTMGLPTDATLFRGVTDTQRHRLVGNSVPVYYWQDLLQHWFATRGQTAPPPSVPADPPASASAGHEELCCHDGPGRSARSVGIQRIVLESSARSYQAALRAVRDLDDDDLPAEDGELRPPLRDVAVQVLAALATEPPTTLPDDTRQVYNSIKDFVRTCDKDAQYQRWFAAASSTTSDMFFDVQDGLLFRVRRYGGQRRALVLPSSQKGLIHRALHLVHDNEALGAHASARKTFATLQQYFYFDRMATIVADYCRRCSHCQLHRARTQRAAPDLHMIPMPPWPGYRLHTDIVLGLPRDEDTRATAIWVWQCAFSRRSVYIPIRMDTGAVRLLRMFLERVLNVFGIPHEIIGDRDAKWASTHAVRSADDVAFVVEKMTHLSRTVTAMFGTKWSFATVSTHRSNGRAEIQIKTVTDALSKYSETFYGDENWTRRLALLEFAYNNQSHSSMDGLSPNQVFMGRRLPGPLDEPGDLADPEVGSHRYFTDVFRERLLASRETARNTVTKINDKIEARHRDASKRASMQYRRNQLVKVPVQPPERQTQPVSKLSPRWEGPYRVVAADANNVVIAWTYTTKRSAKFNVKDVLPWFDVNVTDQFPLLELKPSRSVPPPLQDDGSAPDDVQIGNTTVPVQLVSSVVPQPADLPATSPDVLLGSPRVASQGATTQQPAADLPTTSPIVLPASQGITTESRERALDILARAAPQPAENNQATQQDDN